MIDMGIFFLDKLLTRLKRLFERERTAQPLAVLVTVCGQKKSKGRIFILHESLEVIGSLAEGVL